MNELPANILYCYDCARSVAPDHVCPTITLAEVRERVAALRENSADYEAAHGDEDRLHRQVLRAVVEQHPDAVEMARVALETVDIDFPRYCA